jgi:hypothetical protein
LGVSSSPEALVAKLSACASAYADLDRTLVREAAALQRGAVLAVAPARLRGVGKNGAKLSVSTSYGGSAEPQALVFARGPWQLIERDTSAHQIPRQRRSATFEGVFGHAVVPGGAVGGVHGRGGVRTRVQHPGTKGQHPWAKGTDAARPAISRLFQTRGEAVLRAVF